MRSFSKHKLMTEFVENLFEFNLEDRPASSLATWSSKGFDNAKWVIAELSQHGITLTEDSIFKIVKAPSGESITIGGGTVDQVKRWTELYDGPPDEGGKLLATIGWTKVTKGIFKELQSGVNIVWGNNTTALETAQCMGVYLDVDAALAAFQADNAKGRAEWIPKIESVFGLSQDWNSKGVSFLKKKMPKMPDSNYLEMLLLAKGVNNFVNQYGKNLGGSYHIIHGDIDKYYAAETANFKLDKKSKANTADFILANASASKVIDAVYNQVIKGDEGQGYCYTNDGRKIKYYQISLKMAHGQLGKVTQAMKDRYDLSDSSEFYVSIVNNYLVNHGYELNEGVLSWAMDKVSQGLSAMKAISMEWFEKIAGYVNKLKDWAKGLATSFTSKMPSGSPNSFQINLMQDVLREDGRLGQGELLTEAKIDLSAKGITELLKTTNQAGAQKIVKKTNDGISTISKWFAPDALMAYAEKGTVDEGSYTQKGKTNSWKYGEIIKIFANATAVDAFSKMVKEKKSDLKGIVEEQIDLAREIYFGKTELPLFKVYGAKSDTDTDTIVDLGTAKDWTKGKLDALTGDTLGNWPVIGFSTTLQKGKYYNISAGLIAGTDKKGAEPEYVNLAMRTNRADAYSFVVEGSSTLTFAQFKNKFGI